MKKITVYDNDLVLNVSIGDNMQDVTSRCNEYVKEHTDLMLIELDNNIVIDYINRSPNRGRQLVVTFDENKEAVSISMSEDYLKHTKSIDILGESVAGELSFEFIRKSNKSITINTCYELKEKVIEDMSKKMCDLDYSTCCADCVSKSDDIFRLDFVNNDVRLECPKNNNDYLVIERISKREEIINTLHLGHDIDRLTARVGIREAYRILGEELSDEDYEFLVLLDRNK